MLLESDQTMVFLGEDERESQKGNKFTLIRLADPVKFENYDFFKQENLNVIGINKGDQVSVSFELSKRGFNNDINLVRLDPLKK